jgi:hypothetical protein
MFADKMNLPSQWAAIDPDDRVRFEDEYAVEIAKGHPLYGVLVRAIAKRQDCDDVLFELLRHLCEYAVVHLTWTGKEEVAPDWPGFELYADDDDIEEILFRKERESG